MDKYVYPNEKAYWEFIENAPDRWKAQPPILEEI
jgi:hypothetical protein